MQDEYIRRYRNDLFIRTSLQLLLHHVTWPDKPKTLLQYGVPFSLSATNAPFVQVFINIADRCLYHSSKAWRVLHQSMINAEPFLVQLPEGSRTQILDAGLRHEIEAFLTSAGTLFDKKLNQFHSASFSRSLYLANSCALPALVREEISKILQSSFEVFKEKNWKKIRDSVVHINDDMSIFSGRAHIEKVQGQHRIALKGAYQVGDSETDLISCFSECHLLVTNAVTHVRDLLLAFSIAQISEIHHNTYAQIVDDLGNMVVGLEPDGFSFRVPESDPTAE